MHKINNWYLTDILLSDAGNLLMLVSRLSFYQAIYHQQTYAIFLVPWTTTGIKVAVCRLVNVNIVVEDTGLN